jgi:hypothetical protein
MCAGFSHPGGLQYDAASMFTRRKPMEPLAAAHDTAERVRRKEISAREAAQDALKRIEAANPALNAFIHVDPEAALRQADAVDAVIARGIDPGPLAGVPVGVKDMEPVTGMPLTYGSRAFAHNVADHDSVQVSAAREDHPSPGHEERGGNEHDEGCGCRRRIPPDKPSTSISCCRKLNAGRGSHRKIGTAQRMRRVPRCGGSFEGGCHAVLGADQRERYRGSLSCTANRMLGRIDDHQVDVCVTRCRCWP